MTTEALYAIYKKFPNVQTDTRKLQAGDLFFALRGPNFNGNAYAAQAIEAGAAYAVIDDEAYFKSDKTILVPDVLHALQQLALHHRRQLNIPFLAITGSNGKTTTKELVHAVLSTQLKTYTTSGNLNNHIGVPLTILKIRNDAEMAVIEMGANHQREIALYCTIAEPTHGLITNCGKAHLEGFGGVEGVRKGKGELFDYLRSNNGTAFIMNDYEYLQEMSRGIAHIHTYGTRDAEITGSASTANSLMQVHLTKGIEASVNTQLVGAYNLPNVLAAVAVGKYFNIQDENIINAIENYHPTNSRSQLVAHEQKVFVLDAYNANPSSMLAAIDNFSRMPDASKVVILGAMAELGEESLHEHRQLINELHKHNWQHVLLVGGDFLKVEHPYHSFTSPADAGRWLQQQNFEQATFLIKGSRSMQMEKVLDYLK